MDKLWLWKHLTMLSSSGPLNFVFFLNLPFSGGIIAFLQANPSFSHPELIHNLCKMTLAFSFQRIVSSISCLPRWEAKLLFIRRDMKHTVSHCGRYESLHWLMVRNGHMKFQVSYFSWVFSPLFQRSTKNGPARGTT